MRAFASFMKHKVTALRGRGSQACAGPSIPPLQTGLTRRRTRPAACADSDILRIACPDPTAEERARDRWQNCGQHLARQENWDCLSQQIDAADRARGMTPGSMPVAELMAYGARADVILAAEHALMDGRPARGAPLLQGIEALEHVLAERPTDHITAVIVAQSHMDIGWAWRGTGRPREVPARNREAFSAHFDRAADILADFAAEEARSPLLAAARCALLVNAEHGTQRVADRYAALIDLNPANPRAMRAMGNHLLPRWFGSYAELELEARRTAARTQAVWGAGGYTWVQFDAIAHDDQACANLDVPFFVEGLHDILSHSSNPYTANVLAAYCANSLGRSISGDDQADQNRSQIADCARWIIRDHLTELHPLIWAHAAQGFDNNLRVRCTGRFAASGREDAKRIITSLFSREIAAGKRIVFTEDGAQAVAG